MVDYKTIFDDKNISLEQLVQTLIDKFKNFFQQQDLKRTGVYAPFTQICDAS